ncbi:HAMP domain-containing protein, partial [Agrobacterium sp. a22-2]|uniref:HAMP domain-containing protein n=1 Tax=Agrobacterium sp. a22-2 TaxID=2283840 RepID=UPI0034CF39C5
MGMATLAIVNLSSLNSAITDIVKGPAASLIDGAALHSAVSDSVRAEKNAILNKDPAQIDGYLQTVQAQRAAMQSHLTNLDSEATAKVKGRLAEFHTIYPEWIRTQDQILALARENTDASNARAAEISMGSGAEITETLFALLQGLDTDIKEDLQATDEATNVQYSESSTILTAMAIGLFVFSAIVAFWIAISINNGLKKIAVVVNAVALGDLNQKVEVKTNDEIKDLVDTINTMTSNLRDTAATADMIALGDLSTMAKTLSDRDALGLAMQAMITNLRLTSDIANQIANGDLTVSPKPLSDKDILGLSLQSMVERLRGVVADALAAADNVSSGSQELSASSEQLSQGATEQASSAEEAS